jgi:hypothetical protein
MSSSRTPFVIDERCLRQPTKSRTGIEVPPPAGWEVVNLPDGGLAVSKRVLDVLRAHDASCQTRPLVSFETAAVSERMAELIATVFVPVPCTRHVDSEATKVCATCGLVLEGRIELGWHVPRDVVGNNVMFSRHPLRVAQLYFARSAYEALVAQGVAALAVLKTARACDHARQG